MKYFTYILLSFFLLTGCDYQGDYTFIVSNQLPEETVEIVLVNTDKEPITINSGETRTIIIVNAPLNSSAHNCLEEHGIDLFREIVFDIYIDGVKLERQLWQASNWEYRKMSKWSGEYKMNITEDLLY